MIRRDHLADECDALKQCKSGGAPASSRAGLAMKPAREDAGTPFSEERLE